MKGEESERNSTAILQESCEREKEKDKDHQGTPNRRLTLHWLQHNFYVICHTQMQTKVTLFSPVYSSHRLQK